MNRWEKAILALAAGLIIGSLLASIAGAETEREACERLAPRYQGKTEVRLWDGTRCDLLTAEEAIEVEWATKHYEAPAQATWYAMNLDRRPAVVLLVRNWEAEQRHIYRCTAICAKLGIKLYLEPSGEALEAENAEHFDAGRSGGGVETAILGGNRRLRGWRSQQRQPVPERGPQNPVVQRVVSKAL